MKNLKKILSEEIQKVRLELLEESIISDIMSLILSPKVKKAMKNLKDDPDFIELERQIKVNADELNAINRRLEKNLSEREKHIVDMKKAGIKVEAGMNGEQMFRAYKEWQEKLNKSIGLKKSGIQDWEKYFKK